LHAQPIVLSSSQRDHIRDKIKRFKSDIDSDDNEAAAIDKKIEKKSSALKELLLKAKHIRSEGDSLEDEAKQVWPRLSISASIAARLAAADALRPARALEESQAGGARSPQGPEAAARE
jgi:hypothetical protein